MNKDATFNFRLYVAGNTANSKRAATNLTALCKAYFSDDYDIQLVNVLEEPERALSDRVCTTPTLLLLKPGPVRRIVGTLRHAPQVLDALGLKTSAARARKGSEGPGLRDWK
jgi:circadian clock protein KaiB